MKRTLPSLIASHLKYRIVELTLIGELNGTDLRYIREMSGCDANGKETGGCLSVLDLSGVNIVDGEIPIMEIIVPRIIR